MYQAQRYFHTLELDKVLAKLADQANCDDSKRMALSLTPSDDFSTVQLLKDLRCLYAQRKIHLAVFT